MFSVVCEHSEAVRAQIAVTFGLGTLTVGDKLFVLRDGASIIGAGVISLTDAGAHIGKLLPADIGKDLHEMLLRAMLFSFSGTAGLKITADKKPEFPGFTKNGGVWEIISDKMIFNCGGK